MNSTTTHMHLISHSDMLAAVEADRARTLAHNLSWAANGKVPYALHGQTYYLNYRDLFDQNGNKR